MIAKAEQGLPSEDPKLASLKSKREQLARKDAEHRQIHTQRTFMRPNGYRGPDLETLRTKAAAIVSEAKPDAEIFRTTAYSGDWQERSVLEHTDATRTAVRHRVTRSINAQVAAKGGAKMSLHTLHIAKDRRSDGSGGELHGHIMYSDPIPFGTVIACDAAAARR